MSSQLSSQRFTPSLSLDDSPGRRRCCQRARGRVDGLFADQVVDDREAGTHPAALCGSSKLHR